jgi:hypothetical protein
MYITTNCNNGDEDNYILDEGVNESYSGSFLANKTVLKNFIFFGLN